MQNNSKNTIYSFLLFCAGLVACSAPLDPSRYETTLLFTKDTFPDQPKLGTEGQATWIVTKDDQNAYTLFVVGGAVFYSGRYVEELGAVKWHETSVDTPKGGVTEHVLELRRAWGGFKGTGIFNVKLCFDCVTWTLEAKLYGKAVGK